MEMLVRVELSRAYRTPANFSSSNVRLMAATSFIFAPFPSQAVPSYHPAGVCITPNRTLRRQSCRKILMGSSQNETSVTPQTAEAIIRDIWNKCENAKFTSWLPYFDESAVYHDTLYPNPFVGKSAIMKHLKNMESAIPPSIVFVLDDIAAGSDRVGARWHAETGDGIQVPFSRGASMYSFIRKGGRWYISEAWDFPETPFKLAGIVLPLFRGASAVLNLLGQSRWSAMNSERSE